MTTDPVMFMFYLVGGLILFILIYVIINDVINDWKFAAKKLKESREEENVRESKTW